MQMDDGCDDGPRVGLALWLLKGRPMPERIAWLASHGFSCVALLPNDTLRMDPASRVDAAEALKKAGMLVTYHANVVGHLGPGDALDENFVRRLIEDVLWWHENAGGVFCCCADPVNGTDARVSMNFLWDQTVRFVTLLAEELGPSGIRAGIENVFGEPGRLCSVADLVRFADACGVGDVGVLLDAGHLNIHVQSDGVAGENTVAEFVSQLPLDVLEVHLSDNHGAQDEHAGLGQGNLDLTTLVPALRARGFSGPFTLEIRLDALAPGVASDIEESAKVEMLQSSREAVLAAWRNRTP